MAWLTWSNVFDKSIRMSDGTSLFSDVVAIMSFCVNRIVSNDLIFRKPYYELDKKECLSINLWSQACLTLSGSFENTSNIPNDRELERQLLSPPLYNTVTLSSCVFLGFHSWKKGCKYVLINVQFNHLCILLDKFANHLRICSIKWALVFLIWVSANTIPCCVVWKKKIHCCRNNSRPPNGDCGIWLYCSIRCHHVNEDVTKFAC